MAGFDDFFYDPAKHAAIARAQDAEAMAAINALKYKNLLSEQSAQSQLVGGVDPYSAVPDAVWGPRGAPTGTAQAQDANGNWQRYSLLGAAPKPPQGSATNLLDPNAKPISSADPGTRDLLQNAADSLPSDIASYGDQRSKLIRQSDPAGALALERKNTMLAPYLAGKSPTEQLAIITDPAKYLEKALAPEFETTSLVNRDPKMPPITVKKSDFLAHADDFTKRGYIETDKFNQNTAPQGRTINVGGLEQYQGYDPMTRTFSNVGGRKATGDLGQTLATLGAFPDGSGGAAPAAGQPAPARAPVTPPAPAYDPVAATDRDPARRPWLNGSQAPGVAAPAAQAGPVAPGTVSPDQIAQIKAQAIAKLTGGSASALGRVPDGLTPDQTYEWVDKNLPNGKEVTALVRQIVAGDKKPPPMGRPGGLGEQVNALLAMAHPEVSQIDIDNRFNLAHQLNNQKQTELGGTLNSGIKVINHAAANLGDMMALHNGNSKILNYPQNLWREANSDDAMAAVDLGQEGLGTEFAKFSGGGAPGESAKERVTGFYSKNAGMGGSIGSIGKTLDLMEGQFQPVVGNYNRVFGTDYDTGSFLRDVLKNPKAADRLDKMKKIVSDYAATKKFDPAEIHELAKGAKVDLLGDKTNPGVDHVPTVDELIAERNRRRTGQ